jgi:hypothetical protein
MVLKQVRPYRILVWTVKMLSPELGGEHVATGVHQASWRRGGGMAARRAGAAAAIGAVNIGQRNGQALGRTYEM